MEVRGVEGRMRVRVVGVRGGRWEEWRWEE